MEPVLKLFNFYIILCLFLCLSLFSCVFSFENISLTSNITDYFEEDFILLKTTVPLDKNFLKDILILKIDDYVIDFELIPDNNFIKVKPSDGWKFGKSYRLQISGTVKTSDSRLYRISYIKHFIYGTKDSLLKLENYILPETDTDKKISFTFNKPIDIKSFENGFSISPYIQHSKIFSKDYREVTILPASSWNYNTLYTCKIDNIESSDNCVLNTPFEKLFSISETIQPELTAINRCQTLNLYLKEFNEIPLQIYEQNIPNISPKDSLSFSFNTKIKLDSFKSNFSIVPTVTGNFISKENTIYFIPEKPFTPNCDYIITINQNTKAENSLSLYSKLKYSFHTDADFLNLQSISINGTSHIPLYESITNNISISEIEVSDIGKTYISFTFDKPLATWSLSNVDKAIKIEPYFPLSLSQPHLLSISLINNNLTLILEYDNFTTKPDQVNTYKISVNSNPNYIISSENNTLENNLCTLISVK